MIRTLTVAAALVLFAALGSPASAQQQREVEITGDLVCGKCKLKKADSCENVLIVKEREITLADSEAAKGFHKKICSGDTARVTVIGSFARTDSGYALTANKITPAAADAPVGLVMEMKGTLVCGKCKLGKADSCESVLLVEYEGETHEVVLAQNEAAKKFHGKICGGEEVDVVVKGSFDRSGDRPTITAREIRAAG